MGGHEPEKFYHAFVLGLMISLTGRYEIKSNRESGYGRYDVLLAPLDRQGKGIIMEFKKADQEEDETLEETCKAALRQIKEKAYSDELAAMGIGDVPELVIAFRGKEVMVMSSQ